MSSTKSGITRHLRLLVALLILAALVFFVDVNALLAALSQLTVKAICYLALISVALVYISALKWGLFLEALGRQTSSLKLFALYHVGYFVNLVLPSYLGGDAVRSAYMGKEIGQHQALAATILERYTGIVAMVVMALVCVWFVDLVTLPMKIAVVLLALGLVTLTALALSTKLLKLLATIPLIGKFVVHLNKIQAALLLAGKNPELMAKALALSVLYHLMTVVNTIACGYAVGWYDPPIGELFVVVPLILIVAAIPAAPNSLGIQEGAFLFFLQGVGATPAQALGLALVLRAKGYVLALVGGLFWLQIKYEKKDSVPIIESVP